MTIKEISEELQNTAISPGRLSELHILLSSEYAFISSRLIEILKVEDQLWKAIRDHSETDAQATREWGTLPEIIDMKCYKQQCKVIEKMMSSIKLRISVMTEEARNQY